MNRILAVLFFVFLALGASAQKAVIVRPPVVHRAPRVVYYYPRPYYYNPYYMGFNYGFNAPAYYHYNRPTKLDRQIEDIKNEYSDRISSVKADDSLSHHDQRKKVRALKHERDQAVEDAKKNYYKQYEN